MHLKDLYTDETYRTTNVIYSKGSPNLSLKRMQFILPFKISVFIFGVNWSKYWSKFWLYKNHFQLNLQDQFLLLSSKGCFFQWSNSDIGGNKMLFQFLSTNAEQIQCVLKIVFEFMITQMTQRTRHKGSFNRFIGNTNVLGINFYGQKQIFVLNIKFEIC